MEVDTIEDLNNIIKEKPAVQLKGFGETGIINGKVAGGYVFSSIFGNRNDHSTAIGLSVDNGALLLNVYINVRDDVKVKAVAEEVQKNVKDKVQSMTGNAVARVNVYVDDMIVKS